MKVSFVSLYLINVPYRCALLYVSFWKGPISTYMCGPSFYNLFCDHLYLCLSVSYLRSLWTRLTLRLRFCTIFNYIPSFHLIFPGLPQTADVTFVIHASTEPRVAFSDQKRLVSSIIDQLGPYGADAMRVAVVVYGDRAEVPIQLYTYNRYRSKEDLKRAINQVRYYGETGANFTASFRALQERVYTLEGGSRENASRVVFWFVGYGRVDEQVRRSSVEARMNNIGVVPLGFSQGVTDELLRALAWNLEFTLRATTVSSLSFTGIMSRAVAITTGRLVNKGNAWWFGMQSQNDRRERECLDPPKC